jgi:DNA-binding transcriptional MerR regulator
MHPRHHTLRIGEVAASSGLTVDAVRYYERVVQALAQQRRQNGRSEP